jgi:predicted RecA/RadA family phage recombinase
MARNYVQPGDTITVIAPRAVSAGSGVLVGALFGVALADAAQGAQVEIRRVNVWDLVKTAGQAWTQGIKLYWDNAAFAVTTTANGNLLIGTAAQAQASADIVGRVLLTGQIA